MRPREALSAVPHISKGAAGEAQLAAAEYDPVVLKLEARYHCEVLLGETIRDTLEDSGLSHDGTMWKMSHSVAKMDGEKAANDPTHSNE
jgi:hypothetical protein